MLVVTTATRPDQLNTITNYEYPLSTMQWASITSLLNDQGPWAIKSHQGLVQLILGKYYVGQKQCFLKTSVHVLKGLLKLNLPVCMGYRPVIIALRVGEQIGST